MSDNCINEKNMHMCVCYENDLYKCAKKKQQLIRIAHQCLDIFGNFFLHNLVFTYMYTNIVS